MDNEMAIKPTTNMSLPKVRQKYNPQYLEFY